MEIQLFLGVKCVRSLVVTYVMKCGISTRPGGVTVERYILLRFDIYVALYGLRLAINLSKTSMVT